ncbi:MAG: hypothetical protein RJA14_589, partial [Pseudomonadota bacterium]
MTLNRERVQAGLSRNQTGIMAKESGKVAAQANLKLVTRDDGD